MKLFALALFCFLLPLSGQPHLFSHHVRQPALDITRIFEPQTAPGIQTTVICTGDPATDFAAIHAAVLSAGGQVIIQGACQTAKTVWINQPGISISGGSLTAYAGSNLGQILFLLPAATGVTISHVLLDGNRANGGTQAELNSGVIYDEAANLTLDAVEIRNGNHDGLIIGANTPNPQPNNIVIKGHTWIHDNGAVTPCSDCPGGVGNGVGINTVGNSIGSGLYLNDVLVTNNYSPMSSGPGQSAGIQVQATSNIVMTDVTAIDNYNVEGGQVALYRYDGACNQPLVATINGLRSIMNSRFNNDYTMGMEVCGSQVAISGSTILTVADSALAADSNESGLTVSGSTIVSTATGTDPAGYPSAAILFGDIGSITLTGLDLTGSARGFSFVGCPASGRILVTGVNAYGVPAPVAGSCYQQILGSGLLSVSNSPGL